VQRFTPILPVLMLALCFQALVVVASTSPLDISDRAPKIVAAANAWHTGDPIPAELQRYRASESDLPSPDDTDMLIDRVTNLPLLAALAADLNADLECREDAFIQGTYFAGPNAFFSLLTGDLSGVKASNDPWVVDLRQRIALPHVVVDALSIDDADMSRAAANMVMDRIERELRGGADWTVTYRKYADEFGYRTSNRTSIGNLGHFVVYPDRDLGRGYFVNSGPHAITYKGPEMPRRLARLSFFDAAHLPQLMKSSRGDVIRLHSAIYSQFVLYQVQEVYAGPTSPRRE
jgi:hypothetical protein